MKLFKIISLLLFALIAYQAEGHTDVTVSQARSMINSNDDLIVVDVRENSEYCPGPGHIIGVVNYPWSTNVLKSRYGELPINGTILVVCKSGYRSNEAANFLDGKGFSHVYDMTGGMNLWTFETVGCVSETNTGSNESSLRFDAEEVLENTSGTDIKVEGYSVPVAVDWNNDGMMDLVTGQGSGNYPTAKVRVYLNNGTAKLPQFNNYFYARCNGVDLVSIGTADLGCFPVVAYWFKKFHLQRIW